jgi:hypothetical protein
MSTVTPKLGGTPTSITRRIALIDCLRAEEERLDVWSLHERMVRAGHRALIGSQGRYDKLHSDLVYLEGQGVVDRQQLPRPGLPGRCAHWALTAA